MGTPKDMVNGFIHHTKNGKIKIIKYMDRNNVLASFIPSGYEFKAKSQVIREGRVTDRLSPTVLGVAMIGDGPYKNTINYKTTKEYKCWIGMIYRCYNTEIETYQWYGAKGVTVCNEWLNFQNFAKWYEENHPKDGKEYQLDKDINSGEVKIYSPETCIFINPNKNNEYSKAKTFKMISPNGDLVEFYNMAEFCRKHDLTKSCLHAVYKGRRKSHKGWRSC